MNDHKATRRAGPPPVADVHLALGADKCCTAYKSNACVTIYNSNDIVRICHPPRLANKAFTAQEVT